MAIGASSIVTDDPLTSGVTVQIESGTNSETLITSGGPTGSGPYTSTVTTTATKAHAAGAAVASTSVPAWKKVSMYLNTENGFFNLPNSVVNGSLYLGSSTDTVITRSAANVGGMGAGDSFKTDGTWNRGHILMGSYHLWVDATGALRIKSSAPSSDTDGTVVGTQS